MDIIIARPPPADNHIAYTSAVQTIAAQLTEISSESDENRLAPVLTGTINTSETALAGQVGKQETPTETLPSVTTTCFKSRRSKSNPWKTCLARSFR